MNEALDKKRILLTVAYDGTAYSGWQIQPNARTIEGELNAAICAVTGEKTAVVGASRTDAGVHALCNKAVFDTASRIPAEKFSYALNTRLPEDIKVVSSVQVASDFHPRKVKCRKTYRYNIYNAPFPDPVRRLYSYFTYVPLDVSRMRGAAYYLTGTHDFNAFCTFRPEILSTVRTVNEIDIVSEQIGKDGKVITISVTGEGFLYHMVRIIAGTLMEVGKGAMEPESVLAILESKKRELAGPTAPAAGLVLYDFVFAED